VKSLGSIIQKVEKRLIAEKNSDSINKYDNMLSSFSEIESSLITLDFNIDQLDDSLYAIEKLRIEIVTIKSDLHTEIKCIKKSLQEIEWEIT
jgi:hypothetical protein